MKNFPPSSSVINEATGPNLSFHFDRSNVGSNYDKQSCVQNRKIRQSQQCTGVGFCLDLKIALPKIVGILPDFPGTHLNIVLNHRYVFDGHGHLCSVRMIRPFQRYDVVIVIVTGNSRQQPCGVTWVDAAATSGEWFGLVVVWTWCVVLSPDGVLYTTRSHGVTRASLNGEFCMFNYWLQIIWTTSGNTRTKFAVIRTFQFLNLVVLMIGKY